MNESLILGLVAASTFIDFTFAWWWGTRIKNYSLVDAFWAAGIAVAAILFCLFLDGDPLKRLAAALIAGLWGFRLAWHLYRRIAKHHPTEDPRYQVLRQHWQGRETSSFFWFFQAQALSVLILAFPYFLIARDSSPWSLFESLGLALALLGFAGEALADHQMNRFKEKDPSPTSVCREGLWRYSRHPNYFFEMVIWLGLFTFACGSHLGWTTLYAPIIITYLLLRVTGIPPSEASAVERKGDAYRHYQKTTSPFIPLPPKNIKTDHHE